MGNQTTLKEMFCEAMTALGENPDKAVFREEDKVALERKFVDGRWDTDLHDDLADVFCWCGSRVFISTVHNSDVGSSVEILHAPRNPVEHIELIGSISDQLQEMVELSDTDMRDGDRAREMANTMLEEIEKAVGV